MSLSQSSNYSGASQLGNVKENWLFQLFNQDSYLQFDGVDDYIDLGTTTSSSSIAIQGSSESGHDGISVAFWINFPALGVNEPIFRSHDHATNYVGYGITKRTDNKIQFDWYDGSGATGSDRRSMYGDTVLSANTWYFIVITSTFAQATSGTKIYVNSATSDGITDDGGTANITTPNYTGSNLKAIIGQKLPSTDQWGEFKLKNLAIWNARLDASNTDPITAIYNSGSFLSLEENSGNYTQASNLKAYWEFNNGENFAQDLTANIATGTINGAKYKGFLPLAYRDTTVDNVFYHGVVKSSASIRNSIDVLKSKSKTSNISLSIINSKYQGTDLSKELFLGSNNYYNRTVKVFSQLNEISDISECLQLYHGRLTTIKHNDNSINLSIVSKSPWDNKTLPTLKANSGRFFPVVYGSYTPNSSPFGSEVYAEAMGNDVFPVEVDQWGFSYKCLFHKDIGSTDTRLHYYEEAVDAFLPLEDSNNAETYDSGYVVKTKWDLKRHFKFKAIDIPLRSQSFDATNQAVFAFDGTADQSSTSDPSTFGLVSFDVSATAPVLRNVDVQYDVPAFDDEFDSFSSSNKNQLKIQIRFLVDNFYGVRNWNDVFAENSIKIIDQSRYGGSTNPVNTITDGAVIFSHNATSAVSSSSASNVSERTEEYNILTDMNTYANTSGQYEDGLWLRIRRRASKPADASGGNTATIKGDIKIYDVRFLTTLRVRNFNSSQEGMARIRDVEKLYSGADGLNASWDDSAITLGHQAHRDLLIRYAGMPTIEPENYSTLNSDRSTWTIKYYQHEEKDLIKILEKLQYEFGFVHMINPSNGKSKYVWIHGTGTNNAFRAEDVVATLKKSDISNLNISTTSVKDIVTKAIINSNKHPATDKYLTQTTAENSTPRKKYNIKSNENTPTINLNALDLTPSSTIATDKQADFYSYYSQANGDVKKLIDCEIVNIQKGYLLEVGDIIKFDDMVVEPFGSDWNNYYMIVSISRSAGKIKITAREVG